MKKITLILALIMLMVPFSLNAEWMSYKTITASGLITGVSGYYHGIRINTDGSNPATVTVYDSKTASGTAIDPPTVYPTSSLLRMAAISYEPPLAYRNGLYVSISCPGTASVTVYYQPE
jgi:hypothetical protein